MGDTREGTLGVCKISMVPETLQKDILRLHGGLGAGGVCMGCPREIIWVVAAESLV